MVRSLTKVVYKPDSQSTDEYTVIVNPAEYKKWKEGGTHFSALEHTPSSANATLRQTRKFASASNVLPVALTGDVNIRRTIPLSEVVDSFQIFFSNQGAQGILGAPSRQQLDNEFGSHKDVDVVEQILKKGAEQSGKGYTAGTGVANFAKGSFTVDTHGKSLTGI
ncbi:uncharacterized protein FIBRA_00579 [Fibroporia radiculosa]|uniref:Ribosome maturation protein SDO1/SBDS N-terminal domain-containing protein n=1 Tax=Fibroporia radiculosa TaxID=599839 RepID=J4G0F9_9APHY|nr:uncharacterized protein FIBRA_00579 [Fibroporia radiculosa]CCL98578.1 predicted protein [Fibroporia radiculosa]